MPVDHLSYSSISTYLLCPKSWEFRYIKKPRVPVAVAMVFGTAFHKTVQAHIVARAEGHEVKPLQVLWRDCWQGALDEPRNRDNIKWDRPYDYYHDLGITMLSTPKVVAAIEGIEPMVTLAPEESAIIEKRIEFHVPGVPVKIIGYIDMLAKDSVPVDFKTASRKWEKGKEHKQLQVDFYLLGLNQEFYSIPDLRFRYYIFTKTKSPICQVLETSRTWGQLLFTMKQISDVWDAIQAEVFPARDPDHWKCGEKYCSYWDLCRGKEL